MKKILLIILLPLFANAELLPNNILILANSASQGSMQVAKAYQQLRSIPDKNLIALELPQSEKIRREDYVEKLSLPLKKEIIKRDLVKNIKVITTIYGVPLHVQTPETKKANKEIGIIANEQIAKARINIEQNVRNIQKITNEEQNGFIEVPDTRLAYKLEKLLARASKKLGSSKEAAKKQLELANSIKELGGSAILTKILKPSPNPAKKAKSEAELKRLKVEIHENLKSINELRTSKEIKDVKQFFNLTKETLGSLGVLAAAKQTNTKSKNEKADASVDSELSLLWWGENSYPLTKWVNNPFHHKVLSRERLSKIGKKVLMVSRIDAPDPLQAIRIVKDSIKAEQKGLNGKVYIDTRGMKAKSELANFDKVLKDTGWYFRENTDYKVKLDIFPDLIKEAKDAAVYAGWYSLRNFQGDFRLNPGSIAWHIASVEAASIRAADEKGWCKNLIDKGASVTIGAVSEPYLMAFPNPKQFFGLLLTGEYNLVEAYYLTKRFLSWKLVLIGDPLYKPFKLNKNIKLSELGIKNTLKPSDLN